LSSAIVAGLVHIANVSLLHNKHTFVSLQSLNYVIPRL